MFGLGDYEGRSRQGWHRHATPYMLMHFFLLWRKLSPTKATRPDAVPAFRRLIRDGRARLQVIQDRL